MDYADFVAGKLLSVPPSGIANPGDLSDDLFAFQADIVRWALRRGRAAMFADCGLGKAFMSLEWARQIVEHTNKNVLILAPLAVGPQTVREGEKFGIEARYCRSQADAKPGITITNYEMLPHFDPGAFAGVVLDESSILKDYTAKTRNALVEAFARTPFRLCCTATPAPNDFMELGNHAEFLGVMTRTEMLSMFFVHDGGETQKWRLKGHAEAEFWRWICQWAVMVRKPSDLGYPDGDFTLPPLELFEHVVPVEHRDAWKGGMLFAMEARTLDEQRKARRASLDRRVALAAELVAKEPDEQWLVWCELNDEGNALAEAIPGAVQIAGSDSVEFKEEAMLGFVSGSVKHVVTKGSIAGWGMNWQHCARLAYVGVSHSYEQFYQSVRRAWRFGQKRPVHAQIISSEIEGRVVQNLRRKGQDAERMAEAMVRHMKDIQNAEIRGTTRDLVHYEPRLRASIPAWLKEEVQ